MTAQFNDIFKFNGGEYAIAGISNGDLFVPENIGLKPVGSCSACWRGFISTYSILDDRLILGSLSINLHGMEGDKINYSNDFIGKPINGISPQSGGRSGLMQFFNNHYVDLNLTVNYSGGILLADDFIRDLYVHMGFHPAWKYKHVIELIFDKGELANVQDLSREMELVRDKFIDNKSQKSLDFDVKDIQKMIEESFSRKYKFSI